MLALDDRMTVGSRRRDEQRKRKDEVNWSYESRLAVIVGTDDIPDNGTFVYDDGSAFRRRKRDECGNPAYAPPPPPPLPPPPPSSSLHPRGARSASLHAAVHAPEVDAQLHATMAPSPEGKPAASSRAAAAGHVRRGRGEQNGG